jgi:hypothetical protein
MRTHFTLLLLLVSLLGTAQTKNRSLHPFVATSMMAGGQSNGARFYLKNAYALYTGVSWMIPNSLIEPSLFVGLEKFSEETLIPLGLELSAYKKEEKWGNHFSFSGGYSFISSEREGHIHGIEHHGGAHLGFGYGYTWPLSLNASTIQTSLRFRQQFLRNEKYLDGIEIFDEKFSYLLIQFSLRFRF